MPAKGTPLFLVLNDQPVLHRLPEWFPRADRDLIVVSTRAGLGEWPFSDLARHFRHLHVLENADRPGLEQDLVELCRRFGVERVLSTGERDVLRAARLREQLALPGEGVASATAYHDPHVTRSLLTAAGVPVAPIRPPATAAEAAGLAETYAQGDLHRVDGLMDAGRIVLAQPSYRPYPDWYSVVYGTPVMSGMMPDGDPLSARLRETAARVVAVLPAVPGICAFQVELFRTPDDRLTVSRVACRADGSRLVETHEVTLGVNLHGAGLLGQAGLGDQVTFRSSGRRQGYVRFPAACGVLRRLPRRCRLPQTVSYRAPGEEGRCYTQQAAREATVAELVVSLSGPDTAAELLDVETWWESAVRWEDRHDVLPERLTSAHRVRPATRERALHV